MEKKRVLFGYHGELLTSFDFLKEVAVIDYRAGRLKFTPDLLKKSKPHIVSGIGFDKVTNRFALTGDLMDACGNLEFIQVLAWAMTISMSRQRRKGASLSPMWGE